MILTAEKTTLANLVKEYNLDPAEAEKALRANGFFAVDMNLEIYDKKGFMYVTEYRRILSGLSANTATGKTTEIKKVSASDKPAYNDSPYRMDYIILTSSALQKKELNKFIIDTLSLKSKYRTETRFVVTEKSLDDLLSIAKDENNNNLLETYYDINMLVKEKLALKIIAENKDEDTILNEFISQVYTKNTVLVVGRNSGISRKIEIINNDIHEHHRHLSYVYERDININGILVNPKSGAVFKEIKNQIPFRCHENYTVPDDIPSKTGQKVYFSNGVAITLTAQLGVSGTEGTVFDTDSKNNFCVKIFNRNSCTYEKIQKVLLMCKAVKKLRANDEICMKRIAFPEFIVFNSKKQPVGFCMRKFSDAVPLNNLNYNDYRQIVSALYQNNRDRLYGEKHVQIKFARSLAEIVSFLNFHNVILCDINSANILVNKEKMEIYLIDIDSAQICDKYNYYPTNVGMPYLLPPERTGTGDFTFLHRLSDDAWILQYYMFYLLTPFATPYLVANNATTEDLVKNGEYPFQAGGNRADKNVAGERGGIWHTIVGHLSLAIKMAFWHSFHRNGEHFSAEKRLSSYEWLNYIIRYEVALPRIKETSPESLEFMPKNPKVNRPDSQRKNITATSGDVSALVKKIRKNN